MQISKTSELVARTVGSMTNRRDFLGAGGRGLLATFVGGWFGSRAGSNAVKNIHPETANTEKTDGTNPANSQGGNKVEENKVEEKEPKQLDGSTERDLYWAKYNSRATFTGAITFAVLTAFGKSAQKNCAQNTAGRRLAHLNPELLPPEIDTPQKFSDFDDGLHRRAMLAATARGAGTVAMSLPLFSWFFNPGESVAEEIHGSAPEKSVDRDITTAQVNTRTAAEKSALLGSTVAYGSYGMDVSNGITETYFTIEKRAEIEDQLSTGKEATIKIDTIITTGITLFDLLPDSVKQEGTIIGIKSSKRANGLSYVYRDGTGNKPAGFYELPVSGAEPDSPTNYKMSNKETITITLP